MERAGKAKLSNPGIDSNHYQGSSLALKNIKQATQNRLAKLAINRPNNTQIMDTFDLSAKTIFEIYIGNQNHNDRWQSFRSEAPHLKTSLTAE